LDDPLMKNSRTVLADLATFRKELKEHEPDCSGLCQMNLWRPPLDIAFDWIVILTAIFSGYRLGPVTYPFVVFVVANRQRALGNLLHDAGHQNLYRKKIVNDLVGVIFLAPALMSDLGIYRDLHFRHHAMLGKPESDPDYILPFSVGLRPWWVTYRDLAFSRTAWLGSIVGHTVKAGVDWRCRAYIILWWIIVCGLFAACVNVSFAMLFLLLWFFAKGTVFHIVTIFREMCDHFNLEPGGIYSFTRDIIAARPWCWIIHPRNNAYHLSHHLMPSVPYYRLPEAQKTFARLPSYVRESTVCRAYFLGSDAVVHCPLVKEQEIACDQV